MSALAVAMDATRQAFERLWQGASSGRVGDYELIAQALERARVVGVLDAWAKARPCRGYMVSDTGCVLYGTPGEPKYHGSTSDAARAAAAKAIEAGEV